MCMNEYVYIKLAKVTRWKRNGDEDDKNVINKENAVDESKDNDDDNRMIWVLRI